MCGILGGVGLGNPEKIETLVDLIAHRGPDARRVERFDAEDLVLAHLRLAIIDVDDRSSQPMRSSCGRYHITFNGEIYNYLDLREELLAKGYEFRTQSDTEVLLYWLVDKGADGVDALDGMFAFCFYDQSAKQVLLARDHIGEKPLYYSQNGPNFAFCSEIQPLAQIEWVDKSLSRAALKNYLFFLYTVPPDTFYNGIKELAPGHYLTLDLETMAVRSHCYFDLVQRLAPVPEKNPASQDVRMFHDRFADSIRTRLIADVPVGMYLSAGLDSNAIVAQARHAHDKEFCSFTISYSADKEAKEYDESAKAQMCANFYGIENRHVDFHKPKSFLETAEKAVEMFGQPYGNVTCLVAEQLSDLAAKSHKVCLVGDGSDELHEGYPRYKALRVHRVFQALPNWLTSSAFRVVNLLPETSLGATTISRVRRFLDVARLPASQAYMHWLSYVDFERLNDTLCSTGTTEFYDQMVTVFERFEGDPARAAAIVDFLSFVPYNLMQGSDRTSMANSLEIRSPYVAKDLVLSMLSIASANKSSKKYNKRLLVEGLSKILPKQILGAKKKAFNPPLRSFVTQNLPQIREYLCNPTDSLLPKILTYEFVKKEIDDFQSGERDTSNYLWGLSTLECWLRQNRNSLELG
ncbi:MAG: asparagine synthase (glutamine-hydrolyzing) [Pseudomonadota bacterium]